MAISADICFISLHTFLSFSELLFHNCESNTFVCTNEIRCVSRQVIFLSFCPWPFQPQVEQRMLWLSPGGSPGRPWESRVYERWGGCTCAGAWPAPWNSHMLPHGGRRKAGRGEEAGQPESGHPLRGRCTPSWRQECIPDQN